MSQHFFHQLAALQQPLVSYSQQQQWPNQPPAADDGDDNDPDAAAGLDDDLDGEDDDLGADPDDLDADDPADEPADEPPHSDGINEALKAERRRTNQLERELRTMRRQLAQFSKINPDEYERLQETERQKVQLEREIASRERQLQANADRKVRTVAKERDDALRQVEELRKDRLLERLFIDAEGRPGGDNRGSFFDIFKQQVGGEFRLVKEGNGRDRLEPTDSKGNVLLGDGGTLSASEHVESLRTHPVLSFLFAQRGGLGPATTIAEFDGNGQISNLQDMSPSELYRASFATKPAGSRG
ncbi:MAG: hypothetical protein ACRC1L_03965 [Prochlorococcaceae cyanobacterium]